MKHLLIGIALCVAVLLIVTACRNADEAILPARIPIQVRPTITSSAPATAQARAAETAVAAPNLEILGESVGRTGNYLSVVGEVRNNGSFPVRFPKVVATFYDANDIVISTDTTYVRAPSNTLAPGDKAPFQVLTRVDQRISDYRLRAQV